MEIKVTCTCGTRYAFEVEPEHERMPWAVSCPECGADGTALANEAIQENFSTAIPAAAPIYSPPPVAPAPPAPTSMGGLRFNRPVQEEFPVPPAPAYTTPSLVVVQPTRRPAGKGMPGWQKGLIGGVIALVLVAGIYLAGRRIIKTMSEMSAIASVTRHVGDFSEMMKINLTATDRVILYVNHGDHKEVAQAAMDFWKEHHKRELKMVKPGEPSGVGPEYAVMPAHHGYVRMMGRLEWQEPDFEACAKRFSEQFKTMVFVVKDVNFDGESIFGVYDRGSNLFHARMETKIVNDELEEKVTLEHKEWAYANGFKPKMGDDAKAEEFNMMDANEITKKFGMKFWDEMDKVGRSPGTVILKDPGAPSR